MNYSLTIATTVFYSFTREELLYKVIRLAAIMALVLSMQVPKVYADKENDQKERHRRGVTRSVVQDLDAGLIAYFSLDGDPSNSTENCGSLTVNHVKLTTNRFEKSKCAYQFDGVQSSMLLNVKDFPGFRSSQTYSWWYYTHELQTYAQENGAGNMIVVVNVEGGSGLQFGFRDPGYKTLGLDTWMWGGGTLLEVKPPAVKSWHHCVYTFDGKTNRFYLDGVEVAASTVKPQEGAPTQLMFGNYPTGDQFFCGKLDDVRIYNRTLSCLEIESLFQAPR